MPQYQNKMQDKRIESLETQIAQVQDHISNTNTELGTVKNDVKWLKDTIKRIDDRTWWILGTIIIGFVIQLVLKLY